MLRPEPLPDVFWQGQVSHDEGVVPLLPEVVEQMHDVGVQMKDGVGVGWHVQGLVNEPEGLEAREGWHEVMSSDAGLERQK